jgi:hypothetical protein
VSIYINSFSQFQIPNIDIILFAKKKKNKKIMEYNYLAGKSLSSANVDQY